MHSCKEVSYQEKLDKKYGKYIEDVKPRDKKLYNAYDSVLKLWGTPYGEVYIKTRFGKAHVIVSGPAKGKAVVLLHGMNASSTMWYPNVKSLSETHRVYAIDYLVEPGKSHLNGSVKNMDEVLEWYNAVISGLKLKKFSLIGASKGGWQSVSIALQKKHKIEKMILLSPAQTFTLIDPSIDMVSNVIFTLNPKRKKLRDILETMSSDVDNMKQEYIDQYYIASEKASIDKFTLQMMPFSSKELGSIKMPVLVLIGDNDLINDARSLEKANKLLPNVKTRIIQNAGHFLSMDQAKEVNRAMLEFLE